MWKNSLKNSLIIILAIILAIFSIIGLVAGSFLFFIIFISLTALFLFESFKFSLVKRNTEKQNTNIKNKTTKTTWIISGIIILFIITVVIINISGQNNYSPQTPKKINTNNIGDKIDLHIQAQQFVLQGLKAPSTAKFPALPYEAVDIGNDRYKIMSYVDSQNSFGAILRSDWSVVMNFSGDKWILERMVIGGEVVYQSKENTEPAVQSKSTNTKIQTTPPPVSKVIPIEQPKLNSTSDKAVLFGEALKLSDKIIKVYSVGEYIAKYSTPREGYKFIYIDAEIENLTDEDISFSCMLFDLTNEKGEEYERGYPALGDDPENCVTVSPYKKARGYNIFEVPRTREYFQVKYANVLGNIEIDPLHIIFKPNPGWKLESRIQN